MTLPRLRLAVDASSWQPLAPEVDFLLSLLPETEQEACRAFRREDDKKHAIISRLLQRYAASVSLGIPFREVNISRTRGRKPFASNARNPASSINWNYNVSHEGSYVVLCSEIDCIVGCDVAAPRSLRTGRPQTISEYLKSFKSQLTQAEWAGLMELSTDEAAMEQRFQQLWCLKESFSKACGLGLAAPLAKANFKLDGPSRATLDVDGKERPDWAFSLHSLPRNHWVGVARAPPSEIVDHNGEFKGTLTKLEYSDEDWQCIIDRPEPPFSVLPVSSLLPTDALDDYEAAGGDVL